MEIIIHAVGKISAATSEYNLIQEYLKRVKWKTRVIEYPYNDKVAEAKKILTNITLGSIISLDEKGENLTSFEFTKMLETCFELNKLIHLIIGGHDGLDESIIKASRKVIALGKLTWPHKLARVMLAEQVYRAYSISNNHPYHRE